MKEPELHKLLECIMKRHLNLNFLGLDILGLIWRSHRILSFYDFHNTYFLQNHTALHLCESNEWYILRKSYLKRNQQQISTVKEIIYFNQIVFGGGNFLPFQNDLCTSILPQKIFQSYKRNSALFYTYIIFGLYLIWLR